MAEISTLLSLFSFINFFSLRSHKTGVISVMPISLAFSKNHSNLSFDFKIEITM